MGIFERLKQYAIPVAAARPNNLVAVNKEDLRLVVAVAEATLDDYRATSLDESTRARTRLQIAINDLCKGI